jgi:acetylornithine deacetylase/succinyl-diaminopimelate desuccinylase-like protein
VRVRVSVGVIRYQTAHIPASCYRTTPPTSSQITSPHDPLHRRHQGPGRRPVPRHPQGPRGPGAHRVRERGPGAPERGREERGDDSRPLRGRGVRRGDRARLRRRSAGHRRREEGPRGGTDGAADDKAGIAAHIGAVRALASLDENGDLPVTVRLFIEGEEEVASATLPELLGKYQDKLRADVIVIADSGNWDIGVPALTTSLRGLIRVDVELRTLGHAVHSGMWGGLAPDAIMALVRLLNTLWDEDGAPAVEGLVSGPAADVDYPEERLRAESGAIAGLQWVGKGSAVERMWTQPAITITGLDAPKVDGASNTLAASARAKVTIRIAPGDSGENAVAALQKHLEKHVPWGAELTTKVVDTGEPIALDATGPAYDAARAAFTEAWDGTAPIDMGVGGSIPFIAEFLEAFPQASVLVTGVEDPDTRAHGANEGLHLAEFRRVVVAEALLLQKLGS